MVTIDKITRKYGFDVASFENAKDNYYKNNRKIDHETFSIVESNQSYETLCNKFDEIIRICAFESKIKEDGNIYCSNRKEIIPKVGICFKTSEISITIGLFRDFYITTELLNTDNICLVSDEFWQSLFKISELGHFNFAEKHVPSPEIRAKYPKLFNKRSKFFKLTRNYFLNQIEYGTCRSLGYISIDWPNSTPLEDLVLNYCETFKYMYNINHLLWSKRK